MKTIKFTMISPEEKLSLKISLEDVFFVFINDEEFLETTINGKLFNKKLFFILRW